MAVLAYSVYSKIAKSSPPQEYTGKLNTGCVEFLFWQGSTMSLCFPQETLIAVVFFCKTMS